MGQAPILFRFAMGHSRPSVSQRIRGGPQQFPIRRVANSSLVQRRSVSDDAPAAIALYFRFVLETFAPLWYSCALSHGLTGVFSMVGNVGRVGLAAVAVWLTVGMGVATAQDRRQNEPGQFDYYVLALSWSPSFCEASGERGAPPQQQCGARA